PPYISTLSLHDALPISRISYLAYPSAKVFINQQLTQTLRKVFINQQLAYCLIRQWVAAFGVSLVWYLLLPADDSNLIEISKKSRSEEHTSEFQSPCNLV